MFLAYTVQPYEVIPLITNSYKHAFSNAWVIQGLYFLGNEHTSVKLNTEVRQKYWQVICFLWGWGRGAHTGGLSFHFPSPALLSWFTRPSYRSFVQASFQFRNLFSTSIQCITVTDKVNCIQLLDTERKQTFLRGITLVCIGNLTNRN